MDYMLPVITLIVGLATGGGCVWLMGGDGEASGNGDSPTQPR